jgi:hypothetical protein
MKQTIRLTLQEDESGVITSTVEADPPIPFENRLSTLVERVARRAIDEIDETYGILTVTKS